MLVYHKKSKLLAFFQNEKVWINDFFSMMNPSFKRKDRGNKCYFSSCFMFSWRRLFISLLTRGIIKTIYFSKGLERSCRRNIFFLHLVLLFFH
ncbi:hypothetical protein EX290_10525 [Enterococcus faecium]|nr:hypothetical protein CVT45_09325 [Enterococcus faecium Com15]EGP5092711.1 hypothetical protein [Enterococcus faecium]MBO1093469.1 hypothetical protein [Enterococcus lactis]TXU26257.1 hypothetical protein D4M94_10215 [Enterococcus sp. T0168A.B-11]HAW87355.1 hypothetical protein [Enterococcus sp.]